MPDIKFDVVGIGNAIVDVIVPVKDELLERENLPRGGMRLIDEAEATRLYGMVGPGLEMSGGSAANTIAGLASLGSRTAYIGKVRNDQLGGIFRHDIRSLGVHYEVEAATSGPATARCLVLVTPDAQRTMNTFLGASVTLENSDVDEDVVRSGSVLYLEGYLWDPPAAKEAFRRSMAIAREAGRTVALTLSDAFCVDRFRDEFRHLADDGIDLLFANEAEIKSLYQVETFDEALQQLRHRSRIAILTRGEKGSVIVSGDEIHVVDADPGVTPLDTTGAGDLFAAGFLYGFTRGFDLVRCAQFGAMAAAEVISHYGARPEASLAEIAKQRGLLKDR